MARMNPHGITTAPIPSATKAPTHHLCRQFSLIWAMCFHELLVLIEVYVPVSPYLLKSQPASSLTTSFL